MKTHKIIKILNYWIITLSITALLGCKKINEQRSKPLFKVPENILEIDSEAEKRPGLEKLYESMNKGLIDLKKREESCTESKDDRVFSNFTESYVDLWRTSSGEEKFLPIQDAFNTVKEFLEKYETESSCEINFFNIYHSICEYAVYFRNEAPRNKTVKETVAAAKDFLDKNDIKCEI